VISEKNGVMQIQFENPVFEDCNGFTYDELCINFWIQSQLLN